ESLPAAAAANETALSALRYESALQTYSSSRLPSDLLSARQSEERLRAALLDLRRLKISDREIGFQAGQLQTMAADLQTQARGATDFASRAGAVVLADFIQRYLRGTVEATGVSAERLLDRLGLRAYRVRSPISR